MEERLRNDMKKERTARENGMKSDPVGLVSSLEKGKVKRIKSIRRTLIISARHRTDFVLRI